jgi:hypothetical protein
MPIERLIQAAGSSNKEIGFKKINKKFNLPVSFKLIMPKFIPRRRANIKGNKKKKPEIRLANKEIELRKKIKKKIFKKWSLGLKCFLTRFHIHKG